MRQLVHYTGTLILTVALLAVPGTAIAEEKSELSIAASMTDTEGGLDRTHITGEWLAPLGPILIGPTLEYVDEEINLRLPPGQAKKFSSLDLDGTGFGAALEWNITGERVVPFIGASLTYWTGDLGDAFDYSAQARIGVKIDAGDRAFLKVLFSTGKDYGDGSVADRDRDVAFIGFGIRL